jgi:hypothetical protein
MPDMTAYQSREGLLEENGRLTESLERSRTIIRTHEVIEERSAAQLIVQNAHLNKLNKALHARENKNNSERTVLFANGYGRHLTCPESISLVWNQKERKEREAVEKVQRQEARGACKAAKAAAEVEWKAIVTAHERALKEWVDECEILRAQNVRVRDLPRKPKRPPKPKPVVEAVGDEDEDENDEDE